MINRFIIYKRYLLAVRFIKNLPVNSITFFPRLIGYLKWRLFGQIAFKSLGYLLISKDTKTLSSIWNHEATLPSDTELLDHIRCQKRDSRTLAFELKNFVNLRHLQILSDTFYDISDKEKELKFVEAFLPENFAQSYIPIDWHSDFSSNYSWSKSEPFQTVKVGPENGVEIKIPRELSRFQHIYTVNQSDEKQGVLEFLAQTLDWIESNPFQRGVNWACTMDVALRALNWIWCLRYYQNEIVRHPRAFLLIKESLYNHARHIETNLEYYPISTGNHYLSNIAGLLYISCAFPEFDESDRWLLFCLQELNSEMSREVYNDGYAHEGSTHYHRLVAELFYSCTTLVERIPLERKNRLLSVLCSEHKVKPKLKNKSKYKLNLSNEGQMFDDRYYIKLIRMGKVAQALTKPNNLVPQIGDNDSARVHKILLENTIDYRDHRLLYSSIFNLFDSQSLNLEEGIQLETTILNYGVTTTFSQCIVDELKIAIKKADQVIFEDGGIARISHENAFLVVCCGRNGQNQRGGHNHNDKLSFELNYKSEDFIVDGGCVVYTANPILRNKYRSTLYHSTLCLGEIEQDSIPAGVSGLFVLPEQTFPELKILKNKEMRGVHRGYNYPHERTFVFEKNTLTINDNLPVKSKKSLAFNFAPQVEITDCVLHEDQFNCWLTSNSKRIELIIKGIKEYKIENGVFGIGYGQPRDNALLRLTTTEEDIISKFVFK